MVFDGKLLLTDDIHVASAILLNTSFRVDSESTTPPWHLVHFDVHCARCGHDLRGEVEPVCPACRLEFSWADAVPLEHLICGKCDYHLYGLADSRCPECGTAVDWNAALLRYRTAQKLLFEYRWRDRPIRSFVRTWFLALRPSRLWSTVDLHDPPQIGALLVWIILLLAVTTVSLPVGFGIGDWIQNTRIIGAGAQLGPLNSVYYFCGIIQRYFYYPEIYTLAVIVALWWFFSFASLMVFRQSMRLCKVRAVHVFRVCAYALPASVPFFVVLLGSEVFSSYHFPRFVPASLRRALVDPNALVWGVFVLQVVWALRQGYRHYIKMPHSFGVAIASQVIAILATLAISPAVFR